MRKLLLATSALIALTAPSSADVILTLTGSVTNHDLGPQSASAPCIICTSPPGGAQPANFGFNNFKNTGGTDAFNAFSTNQTDGPGGGHQLADGVRGTNYTVGQILDAVHANGIDVFIDVNTTAAAGETLQLFEVWDATTNMRVAHYTGPTLIGQINNNGNGFGDWILSGVGFASSLSRTDQIYFHAVWNGASDGGESFWIGGDNTCETCGPGTQSVPFGPAGTGIPGLVVGCVTLLGLARRRLFNGGFLNA